MPTIAEIKKALRKEVIARRDALSPDERAENSARIIEAVTSLPAYRAARSVMAYSTFGSEIDTAPLLAAVLATGKRLLLPRLDREAGRLRAYRVNDLDGQLLTGQWGIREPDPAVCERVRCDAVDFVFCPGVAFDRTGGRLGYGKAYYDGFFAGCREAGATPVIVAGTFGVQVIDAIPMEPHDVRVQMVITERGVEYTAAEAA